MELELDITFWKKTETVAAQKYRQGSLLPAKKKTLSLSLPSLT